MKELVGRIYRDENGIETIERTGHQESLWEVKVFNDDGCPIGHPNKFGFGLICPKCKERFNYRYDHEITRDRMMCKINYFENRTYCGYCGHKNIIEVEI